MIRILRGAPIVDAPGVGGKARGLARMERAGLTTSPWFVVTADALVDVLTTDERSAIRRAAGELCPNHELLAVRSSAHEEDGTSHSFAGQLESFLDVPPQEVTDRILDVWRSATAPRVAAYRHEHGLPSAPLPPGVIVQRMVRPRAAGVAFSADPVSGRRGVVVVSAVQGTSQELVSGVTAGDTWHVDRSGTIVHRGVVFEHPVLSDAEIASIARLARATERHAGRPQDIEWALADGLYLLQARPITSLRTLSDPDAPLTIWDNSNIIESYSGITTPLTFSFAREIYEHAYRQFCRLMRVPAAAVSSHDEVFRNMLGLVRGRMYYNLLNWYRLLALLPGYRMNRSFMEQMMGVKERLPEHLAAEIQHGSARGRVLDAAMFARTLAGLFANYLTLNRRVDAFAKRLEEALASPVPALEEMRPDELVAHYRALRGRLLHKWDAPLVNDFFAMVFYGLLRQLTQRWLGSSDGALQNDFIRGADGMVSAEPALRVLRLASLADDSALRDALRTGSVDEILAVVRTRPAFLAEYDAYLSKFGERTMNELKLESTTLHEDPLPLLRAVGALAWQLSNASGTDQLLRRTAIEKSSGPRLDGRPLRRTLFRWVLKRARRCLRDRENLRLERTRLFGRVRRIFIELGRRLHTQDVLNDPRDVFYLEVDEVLGFVEGRSTCGDLRSLAAVRRREFQDYAMLPAPPDRFETRGATYRQDIPSARLHLPPDGEERRGVGCSPGVVRGRVKIVTDPNDVDLSERSILVAQHTDPGWIMLFPAALGVLVERGSVLSHAAIVARELGIPAVVSMPGLTTWLHDGDVVEMDGSTGAIRLIPADERTTRCA